MSYQKLKISPIVLEATISRQLCLFRVIKLKQVKKQTNVNCSLGSRNKSIIVRDNTIAADVLSKIF